MLSQEEISQPRACLQCPEMMEPGSYRVNYDWDANLFFRERKAVGIWRFLKNLPVMSGKRHGWYCKQCGAVVILSETKFVKPAPPRRPTPADHPPRDKWWKKYV